MSQPILSQSEVFSLSSEVMAFLAKCGGPYAVENGAVERNVIMALVSGQYVLIRHEVEIRGFLSYIKFRHEDVPLIEQNNIPENVTDGDSMYVTEFAVNGCMREIPGLLKKEGAGMQGLYSHHWRHGLKAFPGQKGE